MLEASQRIVEGCDDQSCDSHMAGLRKSILEVGQNIEKHIFLGIKNHTEEYVEHESRGTVPGTGCETCVEIFKHRLNQYRSKLN